MARIVKKFGGTSIGDVHRIRVAASKIAAAYKDGAEVAVVVSAMGKMTDELAGQCHRIIADPPAVEADEYDVVLSAGEQVTAGLMAMALHQEGLEARSWTGWQIPLLTDEAHGSAVIVSVECKALEADLARGIIPVITGFQGVTAAGRITTLGRGGSDLTAIAVAGALKADRCDIYTDVPGIYTADPNLVKGVRKLIDIDYAEMLLMSRYGAGVLQDRAVESAHALGVNVQVRSSFERQEGTLLAGSTGLGGVATGPVRGIAHKPLVEEGGARPESEIPAADLVVISAIGSGLSADSGLARQSAKLLQDKDIQVLLAEDETMRTRIVVKAENLSLALGALHSAYGLGEIQAELTRGTA